MTRKSTQDDLLSDDPFYTVAGNSIQGSYIPASSGGSSSGSTTGSVISAASGGITINLILDAAAQAAPTSFKNGLLQAVSILAANITDKITVNINIDYSGTGGGAAAGPDSGDYESYAWTRSELVNHASTGGTTFNSLPTGTSIQGQSNVAVWNAELKLWGVLGANDTTTDDASANFSTDINSNLLVGVALHELTHAMGRIPYGSAPDIFDLFRFTSPGVRLFQGGATAPAAYFSLDGGVTKLADYGRSSDPSDFLNSGVQGSNDPFNEYYTSTTLQGLTSVDLKQLDALGFHLAVNSPTTIESFGSTSLVQAGSNYFMNPVAGGAGPELKYNGLAVVAGQFGGYVPIGAEQTATGYDVAWKMTGVDQYTVWSTDSSGNYMSTLASAVSGASYALESLETAFHQDLNGDGTIGVVTSVIEAFGATELVQVANNYFFNPVAGGTGPELKYQGAPVVVGEFADCTPIGAEQTATGYEVAWKVVGTDQYGVWYTDNNGNYLSNIGVVSGSSSALNSLEPSFHQDLNGDGVIGVPNPTGTVIESAGSTTLTELGNNYYLYTGGAGLVLKYQGAPVADGQFAGVTPIGAEQTSTGYEVAWKVAGTDQYGVWYTDASGNYLSNIGLVSGTSSMLESLEPSFHQDLNLDGIIGPPPGTTVIEMAGSTSLTQVGNNYFMNPVAGGAGHYLMYNGSAVTPGQFGTATPIAAEQTATGYEVAWKVVGTTNYGVWYTDSNGNYLSNIGLVSATSSTLESLETSFHQDLNGDGTIGPAAAGAVATSPAASSDWLREFFAAPSGTLADLVHAAQTGSSQLQHEQGAAVDAHDTAGYLAHFLSAQANANLFDH
ncbi:NF038122 family metalloprotease [Bradyrhizobium genosp. A]|uniref:NF038122 family metalloprotease n=1 Tax=Bradyrhizobium genosp. A TaxID=83626 RepID=UPI003CF31C2C